MSPCAQAYKSAFGSALKNLQREQNALFALFPWHTHRIARVAGRPYLDGTSMWAALVSHHDVRATASAMEVGFLLTSRASGQCVMMCSHTRSARSSPDWTADGSSGTSARTKWTSDLKPGGFQVCRDAHTGTSCKRTNSIATDGSIDGHIFGSTKDDPLTLRADVRSLLKSRSVAPVSAAEDGHAETRTGFVQLNMNSIPFTKRAVSPRPMHDLKCINRYVHRC